MVLLGQACMLHPCISCGSPSHGFPPCLSCCKMLRALACIPPPHVLVHVSQSPHGLHVQSTIQIRKNENLDNNLKGGLHIFI